MAPLSETKKSVKDSTISVKKASDSFSVHSSTYSQGSLKPVKATGIARSTTSSNIHSEMDTAE